MITGANRGIGLELVRHYLRAGHQVFAGSRKPALACTLNELTHEYSSLVVLELDVTRQETIDHSLRFMRTITTGLDVLINNAGIAPSGDNLETIKADMMLQTFQVNVVGPLLVSRTLLPLLQLGERPRIVNISSQMGSLQAWTGGGNYSYCSSKAALNMVSRILARDLPSSISVIALHPGWVQTDMGGTQAPLTPAESAQGIIQVIDHLTREDSGKFFTWQGSEHPW
ncbi:SDR family oxidoreductase [candidate division CSSED10-310 bacterium]|uniref:SDR family oxidoreductase n=1 Tax=candidate division CSSED10-310 bacterium TaxID=2855610 RepID=A0ABV6YUH0_UNCC1